MFLGLLKIVIFRVFGKNIWYIDLVLKIIGYEFLNRDNEKH